MVQWKHALPIIPEDLAFISNITKTTSTETKTMTKVRYDVVAYTWSPSMLEVSGSSLSATNQVEATLPTKTLSLN